MNWSRHAVFLLTCILTAGCIAEPAAPQDPGVNAQETYGVFVGLDPGGIDALLNYTLVVIDAAYFTTQHIRQLHDAGVTVYSYLNIGSIEEFRSYYQTFVPYALGSYEGWPGEKWMDVSNRTWQDYLGNTLARSLYEKGIDGFFVDNADVYYVFSDEKMYSGINDILKSLNQYKLPVIVNGGDTFIQRALAAGALADTPVKGVNQESVFTGADPATGRLGVQAPETTAYFLEYLSWCKKNQLDVYLTEYAAANNRRIRQQVAQYCQEHHYLFYIATSVDLNG
jgi:hypothetical protein